MTPLSTPACVALAALVSAGLPEPPQGLIIPIIPREALVIEPVGRYGRAALHTDAIEAAVVGGTWRAPRAGEIVQAPGGAVRTWTAVTLRDDGTLEHPALNGGYALVAIDATEERVMLLQASGHAMVYVNGEPRAGDPYSIGYVRLPVLLRAGSNSFLFHCPRGHLNVKLIEPPSAVTFHTGDLTLPDLLRDADKAVRGAVVVINASTSPRKGLFIATAVEDGPDVVTEVPPLPPVSLRKVAFRVGGPVQAAKDAAKVRLRLLGGKTDNGEALDAAEINLGVHDAGSTHKRTFLSSIDGSVQYFAVCPARPVPTLAPAASPEPGTRSGERPALFLSLHGASVEAIGQAQAYAQKSWGHIVFPTNRRPYGFDWEDWGRLDAMEVLELAQRQLGTDPARTYLTGHSMGGHGAWHLGATFPDRFAAIGPSAGWISFWSYAGAKLPEKSSPVEEILLRSVSPSDTLSLARNYAHHGVYILHGSADDNVPADQAREMQRRLAAFHRDFAYHEQPGAGHWWDASDEPGTDCVDWAPMFDFFARRAIPPDEAVRELDFTTANPEVSASSHWLRVEAQVRQLRPSSVKAHFDPGRGRFQSTTDNVARLAFRPGHIAPGAPLTFELDGQKLEQVPWPAMGGDVYFERKDGAWSLAAKPEPSLKGPHRYGPFKHAFKNRVVLVYGTKGTPEENAWAFAKARYDAETFWYRGNASLDVISDTDFDPSAEPDRNVVVYGSADTNAAWAPLLGSSPAQVHRGEVRIGARVIAGDGLACLFLRPRPGSDRASVGVISGSSLAGMRLTDRLPCFVSGVGFPDWIVLGPETLTGGPEGVRSAGFFGLDWSVETGEFAWTS